MWCVAFGTVLFFGVLVCAAENHKKLIIDNDAGGDDAMAIFLALQYEKHFDGPKVIALTTANGNTIEENVYRNNQRILKVAQRQDVPIYRGAKKSLVHTELAGDFFGVDGLGDVPDGLTNLVPAADMTAAVALIELSKKYKGDLTVITLGPVTNIALAISADPDFLSRLDHLYVAASHLQSDRFPEPEFNAHMDAEAYHIVANNSKRDSVTVFPYSQTQVFLDISKDWRMNVLGAIDSDMIKAQNNYEKVLLDREGEFWYALDPATVALALQNNLVDEARYYKNDIVLCGKSRGIITNEESADSNIRLVYSVKKEEYMKFLLDVFSKK